MRPLLALAGIACRVPADPPPHPAQPPIRLSEPITCEDPGARVGAELEAVFDGDWSTVEPSEGAFGLAAADLDGDGWIDLVVPAGTTRLFLGGPEGLVDASDRLPPEVGISRGSSIGDADGDGDLDIYLAIHDDDDQLLLNRGDATFETTIPFEGPTSLGASWGDADGDGDLDLAVARGSNDDAPLLYLNDGAGAFTEAPDLMLAHHFQRGDVFNLAFVDLDGDADLDLYRVTDTVAGPGNAVAWNDGGSFREDGGLVGLDLDICGMGVGLGDVNGDRIPDLALSDCSDLFLMESSGTHWVDHADIRNFKIAPEESRVVPWGLAFNDLDNDGDLDLNVAYGYVYCPDWPMPFEQLDGLYLWGDDDRVTERSESWGMDDDGWSRGFVVVDLDNDGWLDIVKQDLRGRARMYRARCGEATWLRVGLRQEGPNPFAIGARITVTGRHDYQATRWIWSGSTSLASGGPPEAHFGLDDLEEVDVEVTWPDGVTDRWWDVPTRRIAELTRP